MANTIKIKQSAVLNKAPATGDLVQGELAVNTLDEKLYTKNSSGAIVEIGGSSTTYTLPTSSSTVLGGVKVGANLSIASGVLSATDTNTTYTASSGVTLTGTNFTNSAPNIVQTTVSGSAGSFTGSLSGDVTGTQGATVVGNNSHTHNILYNNGTSLTTVPGSNQLIHASQINSTATGLFPASDNSNSIITLNRHAGSYDSQLGFSSNGRIFYRKFSATAINTTQGWMEVWHSGSDGAGSGLDADLLDGQHGSYWGSGAGNQDTVYTHPVTAGNKHVPSGGSSGQFLKYSSSGVATWATPSYTTNTDTNTTYTGSKGVSLSGVDFRAAGAAIGSGVNLDTYRTTGYYTQNSNASATAGTNWPVDKAGVLTVVNDDHGNGLHTSQTYSQYDTNDFYVRNYYSGSWTSWKNLATDTNTVYTHPTGAGNNHVPSGGSSGQFLKYSSSGVATWATPSYTTNTDTDTWRGIDDTPVNGQIAESISSNWAFDHAASSTAHPRDTRSQIAGTYNNYSHPTGAGNNHVPTGGAAGQFLKYSSSGVATWATPSYTTNTDTNTWRSISDSTSSTSSVISASQTAVKAAFDNVPTHTHSYQAADGDLLAIGGLTGTSGYLKKTAADTWTLDTSTFAAASHTHNYVTLNDAPSAPTSLTMAVVDETIEVGFGQSSTSNIDSYEVWNSIDNSTFSLISEINRDGVATTMSVIDTTFTAAGTIYYKVYAIINGVYSTALSGSKVFTAPTIDVSSLAVSNTLEGYLITYNFPLSRFYTGVAIYMDSEAAQASLSRTGATLVYSGSNSAFYYGVSQTSNNYHQFWVELT